MQLLSVYEFFIYHCAMLLFFRFVMDYTPKRIYIYASCACFIPLILGAVNWGPDKFNPISLLFIVILLVFVKLSFRKAKFRHILFLYILLNCTNITLFTVISVCIPAQPLLIELLVNTFVAALCVVLCCTPIRLRLRQIIAWIPTNVLVIAIGLLLTTTVVDIFIAGLSSSTHTAAWNHLLNVSLTGLQFVASIVFVVLILHSISNNRLKTLAENYEHQIHVQAEHYKNLAAANYESRRFRHDFKNMSIAIEHLLADGQQDQALALIRQCNDTLENPGGSALPFDTGNDIADALLADKQKAASACNAVISFRGVLPQTLLSPTDLCVILGNTLDNAIEACQKLDNATPKTISITCDCSSGFLFLRIHNPVSEKVIICDNHITTTKENKTLHGFGLYSLRSVVKKYDGAVRLSSTDDQFCIEIDLCVQSPLKA